MFGVKTSAGTLYQKEPRMKFLKSKSLCSREKSGKI